MESSSGYETVFKQLNRLDSADTACLDMEDSSTEDSSRDTQEDENSTESCAYDNEQRSRYENEFTELKYLGRGGFASVWSCKNNLDGREYAIKKIAFKEFTDTMKILREVKAISLLQHQHVVRYYQAWIEDDASWYKKGSDESESASEEYISTLYIQMELCLETLGDRRKREKISEADARCFFSQILKGLEHIHGSGVIHRDISGYNIFLDSSQNVKVGDFGLALLLPEDHNDQNATISGTGGVGNLLYCAPEVKTGIEERISITAKVDIFSAGLVFLEMMFSPDTDMELEILFRNARDGIFEDSAHLTDADISLLREVLNKVPAKRPSATDLLRQQGMWPGQGNAEEKIELQENKVKELENTIEKLQDEVVELKNIKERLEGNAEEKRELQENKVKELENTVEKLQDEVVELKNIKEWLEGNAEEKRELQENKVKELENTIEKLQDEVVKLKNIKEQLEGEVGKLYPALQVEDL